MKVIIEFNEHVWTRSPMTVEIPDEEISKYIDEYLSDNVDKNDPDSDPEDLEYYKMEALDLYLQNTIYPETLMEIDIMNVKRDTQIEILDVEDFENLLKD